MNSALFEHIKHRLSETAVPDPDQGWQQMNVLLDDAGGARKAPTLRWWYAAGYCPTCGSGRPFHRRRYFIKCRFSNGWFQADRSFSSNEPFRVFRQCGPLGSLRDWHPARIFCNSLAG